ncbi:hypothetical protein [Desulfosporosinus shakirovi]|uniref:hypothetical protein n=1 Tax=Desulfosporosinus shakirovi TaxID=2885154 RepID=UPI001E3F5220|nr:hypothetical protein [Desulfosporosinus sp. SRJS8]MCB8813986.1 hypothetical protein [Desulfosporosinus sp. SRJS8]
MASRPLEEGLGALEGSGEDEWVNGVGWLNRFDLAAFGLEWECNERLLGID